MKFSQIITAATAVSSASAAASTLAFGTSYNTTEPNEPTSDVAWIEGRDTCFNWYMIAYSDANPCERLFSINGQTYQLRGCGTDDFSLYSLDYPSTSAEQYLVGPCRWDYQKIGCDSGVEIEKNWVCGN